MNINEEIKELANKWPELFTAFAYSVLELFYRIKKKKWLVVIFLNILQGKKTMKTSEIVKEELKKAFPEVAEEVLEKAVEVVCEKIAPRLALEADEAVAKTVGAGIVTVYPLLKPAIEKATDLNHDGK